MRINWDHDIDHDADIRNWVGDDCNNSLNGELGKSHGFVCASYNHELFPQCDGEEQKCETNCEFPDKVVHTSTRHDGTVLDVLGCLRQLVFGN